MRVSFLKKIIPDLKKKTFHTFILCLKLLFISCICAVNYQRTVKWIMASGLEGYINHTVTVFTSEGRVIVGTLKGFDQTINLILDDSHERVYTTAGVEQVTLGLYIVRGDNVALIGEVDEEVDKKIDFTEIHVDPLGPVVH